MASTDSDDTLRDDYDSFDLPDEEHNDTAEADRYVTIIVRDGNDETGPGMQFRLKYLNTFKDAFDMFKAACCKTCRATGEIRFKTSKKSFAETDTPKKVG
jgi:hypothetical protein